MARTGTKGLFLPALFLSALSTASRLRLLAISHYIYVVMASIGIAHLNSYLQPHHSPMASNIPTLTYSEVDALCASNYPCPPGYRVPAGWCLSAGGVPVPPVPQGLARRAAITNHYYLELTNQGLTNLSHIIG